MKITPEQSGKNIADFLAGRFTYRSRDEWCVEAERGRFLVNGAVVEESEIILAPGDQLDYLLEEKPEPTVSFAITVLHEDEDLLVLDKPGNLPCHPGGRFFNNTLWAWLKEKKGIEKPSIINRLDRETSGIVLVAKGKNAARHLGAQFADHEIDKRYCVIVEGRFPEGMLSARGFLIKDIESCVRKKMRFVAAEEAGSVTSTSNNALSCATSFRLLAVYKELSLVEALPETGRTHQIRATLLSLGFPVVGDKLYGVDESFFVKFQEGLLRDADWARLRVCRQALHNTFLSFTHPTTNRKMEITSPLPLDIADLI